MGTMRAREGEEIWETTTDGLVWVSVMDDRGRVSEKSFGGKAGTKLRIKTTDRLVNEDAVYGPSVFENGMLVRIDQAADQLPESMREQTFTTEELAAGFTKNGMAFRSFVDKLNELNTRRMRTMCEAVDASQSQLNYLDGVIREKYKIEGDTPTYREMQATRF